MDQLRAEGKRCGGCRQARAARAAARARRLADQRDKEAARAAAKKLPSPNPNMVPSIAETRTPSAPPPSGSGLPDQDGPQDIIEATEGPQY